MLEQVWFTWAKRGLQFSAGLQARAASPGLRAVHGVRYTALAHHLGIQLPPEIDPYRMDVLNAPQMLELHDLDGERVLIHRTVVAERDPHGRVITYFTHALVGASVTASDAIRRWQSSFWRSNDRDLPSDRVELDRIQLEDIPPGSLSPAAFYRDEMGPWLSWVIQSYCEIQATDQLFIAAPAHVVAVLIYGLTRVFPHQLVDDLTFATWIPWLDLLASRTKVVGTCWWRGGTELARAADALPAACARRGRVLDTFHPSSSSSVAVDTLAARFARFAAEQLTSGATSELDRLRALAEEAGVERRDDYLELYRICQEELAAADLPVVLACPFLATALLGEPPVQRVILDDVAANGSWWRTRGQRDILNLQQRATPAVMASLAVVRHASIEVAASSVRASEDRERAQRLLDLAILTGAGDASDDAVHLFAAVAKVEPHHHNWPVETRVWLLCHWRVAADRIALEEIEPWLTMDADELGSLLTLDLPTSWRQSALIQTLTRDGLRVLPDARRIVEQWETEVVAALQTLLASPSAADVALHFLTGLRSTDEPIWCQLVARLLAQGFVFPEPPAGVLRALRPDHETLTLLLYWSFVDGGAVWHGGALWDTVVETWLDGLHVLDRSDSRERCLARVLSADANLNLSLTNRQRLADWFVVMEFMARPGKPERWEAVAEAWLRLPIGERNRECVASAVEALAAVISTDAELEFAADRLGPALVGDRWGFVLALITASQPLDPSRTELYGRFVRRVPSPPPPIRDALERFGIGNLAQAPPSEVLSSRDLCARLVASGAVRDSADLSVSTPQVEPEDTHDEAQLVLLTPAAAVTWEERLGTALELAAAWPEVVPILSTKLASYLERLPVSEFTDVAAAGVFQAFLQSGLDWPDALRQRLKDYELIASALEWPPLASRDLASLGTALSRLGRSESEVQWLVKQMISRLAGELAPGMNVEPVLTSLADAGRVDVWSLMLCLLEAGRSARHRGAVVAGVCVALHLWSESSAALPDAACADLSRYITRLHRSTRRAIQREVTIRSPHLRQSWQQVSVVKHQHTWRPSRRVITRICRRDADG